MFERFPFRSDRVDEPPILDGSDLDDHPTHVGRVSESDGALAMTVPAVTATAVDVPPGTVEIHRRGESHVQGQPDANVRLAVNARPSTSAALGIA